MIPFAAVVHWSDNYKHGHRVWLPLFLIWLILLPLLLALFPIVFLAGLFLRISAARLYLMVWQTLSSTRNTLVEVEHPGTSLQIRIL